MSDRRTGFARRSTDKWPGFVSNTGSMVPGDRRRAQPLDRAIVASILFGLVDDETFDRVMAADDRGLDPERLGTALQLAGIGRRDFASLAEAGRAVLAAYTAIE